MKLAPLLAYSAALALAAGSSSDAQLVSRPPDGGNQKSSVSQWIGLVEVNVTYNSPDVHAPDGSDRRGKIWGQLVPWGYGTDGFGTCRDRCPWRTGANENTVVHISHDVLVDGKPLPAGSYGLHALPGENEWTLIFSKNSTSWGSFFYLESEDALRVTVKPVKSDYHEWLTYEFTERKPDSATVRLAWEDLAVPFTISVPNVQELYFERIAHELRNDNGFDHTAWLQGAQFCLQNKIHLDAAEQWVRYAIGATFVGQENFQTLSTLAQVLDARGKADEAKATFAKAVAHRSASPIDIHQAARQLQAQGKSAEAIAMFELNAKRFPGEWPVEVGMTRAWAAKGDAAKALEHARKALASAPDPGSRQNVERLIERLEKGDTAIN